MSTYPFTRTEPVHIPYSLVFKRMRLFEKQQEICAKISGALISQCKIGHAPNLHVYRQRSRQAAWCFVR